ncbi:MAG: YfhO family protein [Armatimonadota bacterium]
MFRANRKSLADSLIAAGLLALTCAWLHRVLFGGHALLSVSLIRQLPPWGTEQGWWDPILWDAVGYFAPSRKLLHETISAGHIPLWNPYELCGTPFLANVQSSVLYPLGAAFWLFPTAAAFGVNAALHLFLAGLFTYLWLRAEGVSPTGGLISAISFAFGGWSMAWLELPVFLQTAVWLPLVLMLIALQTRRPSAARLALTAVVLAMCLLGGHLQIAFYCILGALLYSALQRPSKQAIACRPAVHFVTALVLAACLAAAQLLPSAELARYGHRQDRPTPEAYAAFTRTALQPQHLVTLLMPDLYGRRTRGDYWGYGNYAEYVGYVGVLPFGLAILGTAELRRKRAVLALVVIECTALLLALGSALNWPLYFLVPGFAKFGSPGRALVLHAVAMAGLAGFGWDRLRTARGWLDALTVWGVPLLTAGLLFRLAAAMLGPRLTAAKLVPDAADDWLRFGVFAALSAGVLIATRAISGVIVPGTLAIALVTADLASYGLGLNPTGPRDLVFPDVPLTTVASKASPNWRVMAVVPDWPLHHTPRGVLPPNTPGVYGLYDIGGYESLYLLAYKDRLNRWHGRDTSPVTNGNMVTPTALVPDMLNRLAVRLVICPMPLSDPGHLLLVGTLNGAVLYENPDALPRAQFRKDGELSAASITPQKENPNMVEVRLPGSAGTLVLRDVYYPGWTARALPSGRRLDVQRAEELFMSARPSSKEYRVQFLYRPNSFRVGLFLTLLGVSAVVFALVREALLRSRSRNTA